jgi:hypothetical protein
VLYAILNDGHVVMTRTSRREADEWAKRTDMEWKMPSGWHVVAEYASLDILRRIAEARREDLGPILDDIDALLAKHPKP